MKRLITIVALTLLFASSLLPTRAEEGIRALATDSLPLPEGVRLTSEGMKRVYIHGDYTGAKPLFEQAIESDSLYAPAYYQLSLLSDRLRTPADSSLVYAQRAYQLDSTNIWYVDTYAQKLYLSGRIDDALKAYERKLALNEDDPQSYVIVAMINLEKRHPMTALSVINAAELKTGKSSYLSGLKRSILIDINQTDKAIEESLALIEIEPENIEEHIALAELYAATKQDSLAQKQYDTALAINFESEPLLNSMLQFHASREDYVSYLNVQKLCFRSRTIDLESKVAIFERLTTDRDFYQKHYLALNQLASTLWMLYPDDSKVTELYANHLIASGKLDDALEIFKQSTRKASPDYDLFKSVIDIEIYKQRMDSVELYTNRAIELFPDRSELRLVKANSLAYTEKYDDAIEAYKQALEYIPQDSLQSHVWGYIGDTYHQKSLSVKAGSSAERTNMKRTFKSYDKALELNANNPLVLNNYAYFLSQEDKHLVKALDMSGRAIALVKRNATYIDTYAWILYRLGRYDEAKEYMRQAIALNSTSSAELPFHYAEILTALGEKFMAEVYYKKALELGYPEHIIQSKIEALKSL